MSNQKEELFLGLNLSDLPMKSQSKAVILFDKIKPEIKKAYFLKDLGLDICLWHDLKISTFLEMSENHYLKIIENKARWNFPKEDLVRNIRALYELFEESEDTNMELGQQFQGDLVSRAFDYYVTWVLDFGRVEEYTKSHSKSGIEKMMATFYTKDSPHRAHPPNIERDFLRRDEKLSLLCEALPYYIRKLELEKQGWKRQEDLGMLHYVDFSLNMARAVLNECTKLSG